MLEYEVRARRMDAHGSVAHCKQAELLIDTDVQGRPDAFNPAELLLAALAAWGTLAGYLWKHDPVSLYWIGLGYLAVSLAEFVFSQRRLFHRLR